MVSNASSVLLRREIYITAALTGAAVHVVLQYFDVQEIMSALVAGLAGQT